MEVGRQFYNYEELEAVIADFQDKHFVQLYKRDTRRIEAAQKRTVKKEYNPLLVYSGIKYTCVHGGKPFVSAQTTGTRPTSKTMKLACPFMIRIASTDDGQRLVVKDMYTEHNHEINKSLYTGYRIPTIRMKRSEPEKMADMATETAMEALRQTEADFHGDSHDDSLSGVSPPKKLKIHLKSHECSGMERWQGRVAVVTGASSGIGASIARTLVSLGMHVVGCARTVEPIQTMAKQLADEKGSLTATRCDVTKEEDVKAVFKRIRTDPKLGTVHAIVACAGLAHEAPLLSGDTSQWKDMLDVNVLGLLVSVREAVRLMEETQVNDGHIFLINSMSGHRLLANKNGHFYAATKFMVTALTEGIRNELREKKTNTRVSAISPGLVETDFFNRMFNDRSRAEKLLSSAQYLKDKDVADAVVYALTAPPHVQVHDILLRATEQIS